MKLYKHIFISAEHYELLHTALIATRNTMQFLLPGKPLSQFQDAMDAFDETIDVEVEEEGDI